MEDAPHPDSILTDSYICKVFETFLQRKSWPGTQDAAFSVHPKGGKRQGQKQVLLLAPDGRIVLGYHNENNDQVWACSGRGRDGGFDPYRDSWALQDIVVGEIPGCIEYLETLLTEDGTCGHSPLISRNSDGNSGVPARLCFFSQWSDPDRGVNDDIYYLDTNNLCKDCYHKAVPRGFNVWVTTYFDEYNQSVDQNYRNYFRNCHMNNQQPKLYDHESQSFLRFYWPRCYSAKWREPAFDLKQHPRMPGATLTHECWRWLVWNRAPFYIDQLCINPPYRIYADPRRIREEEQRISRLNASAYIGATNGILGVPPGGRGAWSVVELRILGSRAVRLPPDFGDAAALLKLGPGYIVHGETFWAPPRIRFSRRLKRHPDHSELAVRQVLHDRTMAPSEMLPEERVILDELMIQIGRPLGPTNEELERIQQFRQRNYTKTLQTYETFLADLRERMGGTAIRTTVNTDHQTIEWRKALQRLKRDLKTHPQPLIESLSPLSDRYRQPFRLPMSYHRRLRLDPPVFYRPFAGSRHSRELWNHDVQDTPQSPRLNKLYCHDLSPYVYRGPWKLAET